MCTLTYTENRRYHAKSNAAATAKERNFFGASSAGASSQKATAVWPDIKEQSHAH